MHLSRHCRPLLAKLSPLPLLHALLPLLLPSPGSAFNTSDMQQLTDILLSSTASAVSRSDAAAMHRHARLRWSSFRLEACPGWMSDYVEQHRAALHKHVSSPASTRFMMHRCWDHNTKGCPGVGDRIRGLMETFAWAAHSRRTFLLKWEDAAPLESLLTPSQVNWAVQPGYQLENIPARSTAQYWWGNREPVPEDIASDSIRTNLSLSQLRLLTLTHPLQGCKPKLRSDGRRAEGFMFERKPLPGPDIGCYTDMPPDLRSCIFHTLFKPSPALLDFVSRVRLQLLGSASGRYVAVHLRLGGFQGERADVRRYGNLTVSTAIARTLNAAKALAQFRNIASPVLVLTDNDLLRQALQAGRLPGFVSPTYRAAHVQGVSQQPGSGSSLESAQLTSFADLALLAASTCFVGSKSGFTYTSLIWGRHKCFLIASGGRGGLGTGVQWGLGPDGDSSATGGQRQ